MLLQVNQLGGPFDSPVVLTQRIAEFINCHASLDIRGQLGGQGVEQLVQVGVDRVKSVQLNILILLNDMVFDLFELLNLIFSLFVVSVKILNFLLLGLNFVIFFLDQDFTLAYSSVKILLF